MKRTHSIPWLLLLLGALGFPAHAADPAANRAGGKIVIVPPADAAKDAAGNEDEDVSRMPRKTPEPRDPTRGMYDPHTDREGDTRSLNELSHDRLNIDGQRSRSLGDLASPLRERRAIDQGRGRIRSDSGERTYGTPSLHERLGVQDSRKEYRIDSTRQIGDDPIEENGASDYRVYRTW